MEEMGQSDLDFCLFPDISLNTSPKAMTQHVTERLPDSK